jgi:hypothetical protein
MGNKPTSPDGDNSKRGRSKTSSKKEKKQTRSKSNTSAVKVAPPHEVKSEAPKTQSSDIVPASNAVAVQTQQQQPDVSSATSSPSVASPSVPATIENSTHTSPPTLTSHQSMPVLKGDTAATAVHPALHAQQSLSALRASNPTITTTLVASKETDTVTVQSITNASTSPKLDKNQVEISYVSEHKKLEQEGRLRGKEKERKKERKREREREGNKRRRKEREKEGTRGRKKCKKNSHFLTFYSFSTKSVLVFLIFRENSAKFRIL